MSELIGSIEDISTDLKRTFKKELTKFFKEHKKEIGYIGIIVNIMAGTFALLNEYDMLGLGAAMVVVTGCILAFIIFFVANKNNILLEADTSTYNVKFRDLADQFAQHTMECDEFKRQATENRELMNGMMLELRDEISKLQDDNLVLYQNYNELVTFVTKKNHRIEIIRSFGKGEA